MSQLAARFEPLGGAAGDMILAAMIDAGLPLDAIKTELARLPLAGYRLTVETVVKRGIAARHVVVHTNRSGCHHHGAVHYRPPDGPCLAEIESLVLASSLSPQIVETVVAVFRRLVAAEAEVMGLTPARFRFRSDEVTDTLVDIVGAAIAFERSGVMNVFCAPLPMGRGTLATGRGITDVPVAAARELARRSGVQVDLEADPGRQVTVTAAAILTTVASFESPNFVEENVGYGAGEADPPFPNVLRVALGRSA